jgi:anti-anti-sigma factor
LFAADWARQCAGKRRLTEAVVEIGEKRSGNVLVLRPVGRIGNLTSAEFQGRLLGAAASGSEDILIDLAAVDYISSAGLRALMVASRNKPQELPLAEPVCDDRMIERVLAETVRLEEISRHGDRLEVIAAYDGLELTF